MFNHPDNIGQLVAEHHRELLADATGQRLARTLAGATRPASPATPRRRWLRLVTWRRAQPQS